MVSFFVSFQLSAQWIILWMRHLCKKAFVERWKEHPVSVHSFAVYTSDWCKHCVSSPRCPLPWQHSVLHLRSPVYHANNVFLTRITSYIYYEMHGFIISIKMGCDFVFGRIIWRICVCPCMFWPFQMSEMTETSFEINLKHFFVLKYFQGSKIGHIVGKRMYVCACIKAYIKDFKSLHERTGLFCHT